MVSQFEEESAFTEIGVFCGTFNPIHLGHLLIAECARDQFALAKVLFVTSPRPPHRRTDLLDGEDRHLLVSAAVADNPHFEASRIELDRHGPSYTSETIRSLSKLFNEHSGSDEREKKLEIVPRDVPQTGQQTRKKSHRLNLILGADNIAQISQWHDSHYLLNTCRFLVAPRLVDLTHKKQEPAAPALREHDPARAASEEKGRDQTLTNEQALALTTHDQEDGDHEPLQANLDVHLNLMQNLAIPHALIGTIIFPYVAISSSAIRQRLREGRSVLYMVPKAVNDLLCGKNFYGCKDNKLV